MGIGDGPASHQRGHDGYVDQLGEAAEPVRRVGRDDAAPRVEDRAFGGLDEVHRGADLARMAFRQGFVAGEIDPAGPVPGHRLGEHVLGDVDEHGPLAARRREVERLTDDVGDVFGPRDEVIVFRHRHRDAPGMRLLEGVVADGSPGDLPGDRHHRNRVHVGVLQGGDQVRGCRSRGRDGDADPTGGMCVAGCHVPRALLVASQDVPDVAVDDRVVGGEDRSAGYPEYDLDFLEFECTDEGLCSGELVCHSALRCGCFGRCRDMRKPSVDTEGWAHTLSVCA